MVDVVHAHTGEDDKGGAKHGGGQQGPVEVHRLQDVLYPNHSRNEKEKENGDEEMKMKMKKKVRAEKVTKGGRGFVPEGQRRWKRRVEDGALKWQVHCGAQPGPHPPSPFLIDERIRSSVLYHEECIP